MPYEWKATNVESKEENDEPFERTWNVSRALHSQSSKGNCFQEGADDRERVHATYLDSHAVIDQPLQA